MTDPASEPFSSVDDTAVSLSQLTTLARADFRRRWLTGDRCRVEDLLRQNPAFASDPEIVVDLIFAEFLLREELGESPKVDEFTARFPAHGAALRRLIELHRELGSPTAAPALNPPPPRPPGKTTEPARDAADASRRPVIPGYEILGVLGRGGMGVVYRARHERLNRVVALKMILGGGHASDMDLVRFLAEAEAVAKLQHPHIVQVFDCGAHDGLPFIALEYCAGGAMTRRLDGTPLPASEAAFVVHVLAGAVHAAHERGIIHRDLKPGNVLLAEAMPAEMPGGLTSATLKIADFGLAKQLDRDDITAAGAIVGTPSYMAPEQAGGASHTVGPSADVYALGAILYELLTGRPPFKAATPTETLFQVREQEPVAIRQLQPQTPRDLETICHHCLQKDPAKRYRTAAELQEDLRRYLAGEPILARPVRSFERLRKWAKRRPAAAALVVVSVLATLTLTTGSIVFNAKLSAQVSRAERAETAAMKRAAEAEEARRDEQKQRLAARDAEADARVFGDFLINDVLAMAQPPDVLGGLGENVTLRQALDEATPRIAERFRDRPRAEAKLRAGIGRTYRLIGEPARAIEQLVLARDIFDRMTSQYDSEAWSCRNQLALALLDHGRPADAVPLLEDLQARRQDVGGGDLDRLIGSHNLALALHKSGRLPDAIQRFEAILPKFRELSAVSPHTLLCAANLADAYRDAGQLSRAIPLFQETIATSQANLGPTQSLTIALMNNLALAYQQQGKFAEALPLLDKVVRTQRLQHSPDHPRSLASMNNLAMLFRDLGKLPEAESLLKSVFDTRLAKLPEAHIDVHLSRCNLAMVVNDLGRTSEAEALFRDSVEIVQRSVPAHTRSRWESPVQFARCLVRQKKFTEAESWTRELVQNRSAPAHHIAEAECVLGMALAGQEKLAEAEARLRAGHERLSRVKPLNWSQRQLLKETETLIAERFKK
jgi:serine/threonine protein kinase